MKTKFNHPPSVLATDLDGTLIPLNREASHQHALKTIHEARCRHPFKLIFATGRHHASVVDAIQVEQLPQPDWIICDVGTSIYQRQDNNLFQPFLPYVDHLTDKTAGADRTQIESLLAPVSSMTPQAPDHQQPFKISYQCEPKDTNQSVHDAGRILKATGMPYHIIGSIDPFQNRGLIDVLPDGVSKAYALRWLSTHADFAPDEVIFSGDSGNDLAALTSGFRAIVVGNASEGLVDKVRQALESEGHEHLLYVARESATSGVLEGCRHFGLIG